MKVICVVSAKGGVGKSTIAVNLACAAQDDQQRVAILDIDPQGSSILWEELRERRHEGPHPPVVRETDIDSLLQDLRTLTAYDYVFIDMPGRAASSVNEAIRFCDVVLVPSRASMIDLAPTVETIDAATRLGKKHCYVMNFLPPSDQNIFLAAKEHLENAGFYVAPVAIPQLDAFPLAFMSGQSVTEYEPDGLAAKEIRWLWQFVKGL